MKLLVVANHAGIVDLVGETVTNYCRSSVSLIDIDQAGEADLILLAAYHNEDPAMAARRIRHISDAPMYVITEAIGEHTELVFNAMGIGARDVIEFSLPNPASDQQAYLCNLVAKYAHKKAEEVTKPRIWLIGSSSGGPETLCTLLGQLPPNPLLSIIVVQHIDSQFRYNLINWLDKKLSWTVCAAEEGALPIGGRVFLPVGDKQLCITENGCFQYQSAEINNFYHPSIDHLFMSFAAHWQGGGYASILTGMGEDGVTGLLALQREGFNIAVQTPESCKIDAMPRAVLQRRPNVQQFDLPGMVQWVNQWITE
ncbi:chemotaxis protein CheB [Thiolapillus brandeum]|uniref:protein-glutamate methylesterase n=1 Tax=Thiolapillus brandeum TaxID=1076588 RepID=A0A7U6JIN0_9GAMM|nr:chemotaxis protein CheB [Thiolapillus brandeum]BAO44395.1 two-component system chemotaxis family response regulator WspF [Thiolapillus brandeum]